MYHSVNAGKILEMDSLDTLSDGTAGGIEKGAVCDLSLFSFSVVNLIRDISRHIIIFSFSVIQFTCNITLP